MTRHSRFEILFFFLTSAGRIRTAAGKQHDVVSRCFCSLGNRMQTAEHTDWGGAALSITASLKFSQILSGETLHPSHSLLVSFPPSHQISWAYHCYCFHQWLKLFLLIGNRFVPGAKRSRGWHLFSNHSLHRLCPSQWGKSHPHQGALKAWKEDYASAEQSVVHRLGRDWMCGRRRETWTLPWHSPNLYRLFRLMRLKMKECASNIHWKHRMCESTKTIGGFHTKGTLRP